MIGDLIGDVLKHVLTDALGEPFTRIARGIGQVLIEGLTFAKIRVAPAPKKKRFFERRSDHLEIHTMFADVLGTVIVTAAVIGAIVLVIKSFPPPPSRQETGVKSLP